MAKEPVDLTFLKTLSPGMRNIAAAQMMLDATLALLDAAQLANNESLCADVKKKAHLVLDQLLVAREQYVLELTGTNAGVN